ncbi:MAG TPA: transcriptional regulator [Terriglobales bacterium]|nr:transcriptional regulator [Terriglobales bacterium]
MDIKPIKNEENYNDALRRIEELWGAPIGSKEGEELKILTTLIEAYERELYPIHRPSPIDAIKFRLEQSGKDYRSLIGVIGQRTRVYEVMRGDRQLSLNMIRKLNSRLKIPAEVLIQPGRKPTPKRHRSALKAKRARKQAHS